MAEADRPVLVFAHYFGGSARSWSPLIGSLGGDFECVAPDLPGFGGAPGFAEGPSLDRYIDHFASLADDRPWIAVGHSMGGKIALGAAARSASVAGLVLIAPSPPTPEPMSETERRQTAESFGNRESAERRVRKNSNGALPRPVFEAAVDDQMRVDRAAWTWWLERGSRQDISDRTASIAAPTLVLYGDADHVLGSDVPVRVASSLCDARAISIPGGGHLVPLEQPVAVAGAIREFLRASDAVRQRILHSSRAARS